MGPFSGCPPQNVQKMLGKCPGSGRAPAKFQKNVGKNVSLNLAYKFLAMIDLWSKSSLSPLLAQLSRGGCTNNQLDDPLKLYIRKSLYKVKKNNVSYFLFFPYIFPIFFVFPNDFYKANLWLPRAVLKLGNTKENLRTLLAFRHNFYAVFIFGSRFQR